MNKQALAESIEAFEPKLSDQFFDVIGDLISDLKGNSEQFLDKWTSINLWKSIDPNLVIKASNKSKLISLIEDISAIAIFLPIAWTWFTLYQASQAFQQYIQLRPDSTNTFFELWQDGFAGLLAPEFVFGRYAQVSVVAILMLIGLYILRGRLIEISENARERDLLEFSALISQLDILLSEERGSNPKRFEGLLENAAKEIRDLLASGNNLVKAIKDEVGVIQNNIDAVNNASNVLQQTIVSIAEAQETQAKVFSDIYLSIEKMGSSVSQIPDRVSSSIDQTFKEVNSTLTSTVNDFTNNLQNNLKSVEMIMRTLTTVQQNYISRGDEITLRLGEILSQFPGFKGKLEMSAMAAQADLAMASGIWEPAKVIESAGQENLELSDEK